MEGPRMVAETPTELLQELYIAEGFEPQWKEQWEGQLACATGADFKIEYELVSDAVMKAMSDTETPQGILAVVKRPEYELQGVLENSNLHLIFAEAIQDPGNLGTIFRTAEGAGVDCIVLHPGTVDLFNPKTVRATMGSLYRMPFIQAQSEKDWFDIIAQSKAKGVKLFAAHLGGSKFYDEFNYKNQSCGFLIGNEGNGLTPETTEVADELLKIPMEGKLESLNASVAAGILMYEVSRQRRS